MQNTSLVIQLLHTQFCDVIFKDCETSLWNTKGNTELDMKSAHPLVLDTRKPGGT